MKQPLIWYQINGVVQFAVRVLAVEEPVLYVMRFGTPALAYLLTDPQWLGELLWNETVRSIGSVYGPETADTHEGCGPYVYDEPAHPPVSALVFLLQCTALEAHSCGSADYYNTTAWRVLHALTVRGIRHIPGWESLPWSTGFERRDRGTA